MNLRQLTTAAGAAAASLAFAATPAMAQAARSQAQAQAQAQMQVEPIANAELTDAQVESFIDAAMAVQAVVQQYQPQMQAAESQEAAAALQQQAQGELVSAVEDAGLTPETYQSIAAAAQTDPQVAERLNAEAQSRQSAD
ncbi:DUF4168 domain-containing protein [Maricaulaceae bacterium MS644]